MRVLLVVYEWASLGGIERTVIETTKAITALGSTVEVWSVRDAGAPTSDGISVRGLAPGRRLTGHIHQRWRWRSTLARELAVSAREFDLVVAGHVHLLPSIQQAVDGMRAAKPACWVWTYGLEVWGQPILPYVGSLAWADRVLAISEFTATQVRAAVPGRSVDVVPLSVDTEVFVPTARNQDIDRDTVLTVGRLSSSERYKGHDVLLKAMDHAERTLDRPLRLTIVGDGDDRPRLERLALTSTRRGATSFLGRLSLDRLVQAYQQCAVFAMPSRLETSPTGYWSGEGFGIVYLEAQACGRPVVASTDGGAPETIRPGTTGLLADPRDETKVGDAICAVLGDSAAADRMGMRGRQLVADEFSAATFRGHFGRLLNGVGS
jgi:phosphatidylinositol alpha-1,6-mannosyltransferase